MAHMNARKPDLPDESRGLLDALTKAELLELAWHFASRCNADSCDDHTETRATLLQEANLLRLSRGAKPVKL